MVSVTLKLSQYKFMALGLHQKSVRYSRLHPVKGSVQPNLRGAMQYVMQKLSLSLFA